jgi:heat shock protein HslJ
MKKLLFSGGIMALFLLVGCAKPGVVGTWTGTMQMGQVAAQTELTLSPDGKASGTATSIAGKANFTGTYKVDGEKIQMDFPLTGPAAEMAKKVGVNTNIKINETFKVDKETLTIGQSTMQRKP